MSSDSKVFLVVLGLVLLVTWSNPKDTPSAAADLRPQVSAAMAMYTPPGPVKPDEPIECECGGTGKSGDGYGPCICGDNCQCSKGNTGGQNEDTVRQRYEITMESFTGCGPCMQQKRDIIPWLRESGWVVEVVDYGSDPPPGRRYPYWVFKYDGLVISQQEGALTRAGINKHLMKILELSKSATANTEDIGPSLAKAMPPAKLVDKLISLAGGEMDLGNGAVITTEGKIALEIDKRGDAAVVSFAKPYPVVTVRLLRVFTVKGDLTRIDFTPSTAAIYLNNSPTPTTEITLK